MTSKEWRPVQPQDRLRPKKALGQHFLHDLNVIHRIVASIPIPVNGRLLEIGPGEGVLTEHLLGMCPDVILVELDKDAVAHLRSRFGLKENLVSSDILQWKLPSGHWTVVGNFPYNISSQIMFWVLDHRLQVDVVVGMFQREVAQRICAAPGSKDYGILSVLVQCYYDADYLFSVSSGAFRPPPKVESGVIRLIRRTDYVPDCDQDFLFVLTKMAFNQRRKMLRNSIRTLIEGLSEHRLEPYLNLRPEQLGYQDFVKLARLLKP